jgi:hypothetical protein
MSGAAAGGGPRPDQALFAGAGEVLGFGSLMYRQGKTVVCFYSAYLS